MAYLRNNWKLLSAFGAYLGMLAAFVVIGRTFGVTPLLENAAVLSTMIGGIVWPWALIKPSTLRARLRSQGPVVLYLVGFCATPFANEAVSMIYVAIGFGWIVVYLLRHGSGDVEHDTSYRDSMAVFGEYKPISLGGR